MDIISSVDSASTLTSFLVVTLTFSICAETSLSSTTVLIAAPIFKLPNPILAAALIVLILVVFVALTETSPFSDFTSLSPLSD